MSEDHDRCFSILVLGAFSTGVFNTNALSRINIGTDVWGESSSRGRYGLGGWVLLFILGSNLGGVGPERGLRGGGRRRWWEE